MNFLGGGERHNSADYKSHRSSSNRADASGSADRDTASPGDLALLGRPGDVRHFIHKKIFGGLKGLVGGVLSGGLGGGLKGAIGGFLSGGEKAVPMATQCPPGFDATPSGCVPRARPSLFLPLAQQQLPPSQFIRPPAPRRQDGGTRIGPLTAPGVTGEAVLGQFGAGTEPEVFDTMVRRCPRKSVLGADGICYNRGDLRNSDRWWPRGRRPLLTGGDMRAISTASSAAKKLQRKQKQLQMLGLLKKPAARSRPQLPAGHRAELRHAGSGHE